MELTFITVSARPENIPKVALEIERQKSEWEGGYFWRIIFDFNREDGILNKEVEDFLVSRSEWISFSFLKHEANKASGGNHGKDTLIKSTEKGWIYQVDDDNELFPGFVNSFKIMLAEHPDCNLFCFWQLNRYSPRKLEDIRVGVVDAAMYIFNKTACEGIDYPLTYGGDGHFVCRMISSPKVKPWLEQRNLCFYNRIKEDPGSGELARLAVRFGTDKHSRHNYCEVYERLFENYRHKEISFLELGVFRGSSILMWREWFTKAEIYGVDDGTYLNSLPSIDLQKTKIIRADTQKIEVCDLLRWKQFDIIVDDADHHPYSQLKTLWNLWPLLKNGGMYVIEDIQNFESWGSHWKFLNAEVIDQRRNKGTYDSVMIVLQKNK
jgi:hypothetical protein